MPTDTLRSPSFPVGTSVGIFPRAARRDSASWPAPQAPDGSAIASAAVDAAGLLTVTHAGITDHVPLVAYALVNGEHRYVNMRSSTSGHIPGSDWAGVVAARRSGAGTS
jgi:hypothetical protein